MQLNITELQEMLYRGENHGTRPKLKAGDDYVFSLAKLYSANPGYIYICHKKKYIGKVCPKGRYFLNNATCEDVEAITQICDNPQSAAVGYGLRTGFCAHCSRDLKVYESIKRGIGPVCWMKYYTESQRKKILEEEYEEFSD